MSKYHSQTPFFALLTNLLWDFSVDKNNNKVFDNYTVVEGGQSVWNQDCQRLWILVEPMAVASPCPALYCQRRNPLSPQLLLRLCSPPSRLLNFWWDQPILAKSGMSPFKMGNSGTMRGGGFRLFPLCGLNLTAKSCRYFPNWGGGGGQVRKIPIFSRLFKGWHL